jgi:hypothetical protein
MTTKPPEAVIVAERLVLSWLGDMLSPDEDALEATHTALFDEIGPCLHCWLRIALHASLLAAEARAGGPPPRGHPWDQVCTQAAAAETERRLAELLDNADQ